MVAIPQKNIMQVIIDHISFEVLFIKYPALTFSRIRLRFNNL